MNNVVITRKPVKNVSEVNREYSKYKDLYFSETNFFTIVSSKVLMELQLFELDRAYTAGKQRKQSLNFKDCDNSSIIKELATLAEKRPEFYLKGGKLNQSLSDDIGEMWDQDVLSVEVSSGQVSCIIL